jgi:FixJ family two-component response regulator
LTRAASGEQLSQEKNLLLGSERQTKHNPMPKPLNEVTSSVVPTVFVVDDDSAVLKSLSRLLRSAQLEAATFTSSQEFLERFDVRAPGCLVLDLSMPGLNGFELQEALLQKGNALPIIFLTGHSDLPDTFPSLKTGALEFLKKPVNDEDLLKAIHLAIEQDRIARQPCAELNNLRT